MDIGSLIGLLKLFQDAEIAQPTKTISCTGMTPGSPAHIQCLIAKSKLGLK